MAKQEKKSLLIVEDDPGLQKQLKWCFEGYDVIIAGDKNKAINELRRFEPPVVTLDLGLPPDPTNASEGLSTLEKILQLAPHTKVIVVTGNDDHENALRAISLGAYDYYQKPIEAERLGLIVERAYYLHDLEAENRRLAEQQSTSPLGGIIAASPEMLKVCQSVEKIAPVDVTTLILGESGTGKELIAKALHRLSPREKEPFVAINCAAIPETLLESELFGYEKGAFTGAAKQTKGKIEHAEGGVLFLDEIGDLSGALQAKLLRFLQEKVIERVGGRKEIPVDVRVVCATHQDLQKLIAESRFREDLYYRISEVTITIPALKEREGDIILLAKAFLNNFAQQNKKSVKGFSGDAIKALETYPWPGNVRELENKVKRAVIMAETNMVTAEDLELPFPEGASSEPESLNLRQVREEADKRALLHALSLVDNNISKASELLGVSRPTLYDLMNKYGIK
jgi:two-component system NtrC family response regulator